MKFTEFIGITTRNMHVKFEAVRRSYNFWRKNAYSAGPSKQDEILTFSQCSPKFMKLTEFIGITTRNMHVKFEAVWRCYNFLGKNADSTGPSKQDEVLNFLNVLQNSWNLQNLLKSPPETCMWNLRQFGEVTIFDRKMPTAPPFKTGWNFDFFSMFSKIHETYRSYWNHHQKHACEIWGSSEKLQFLTEKCLQRRTFKTGWSFDFSQCSQKFMKFTEFIEITTRNMHVKFEAVRRSYNFWQKNAYSASLQNRMKFWLFLNVLQNSWNLQELLESPPETCMWNLRQFREVTIFDGKMPTAPNLQNRMKFWHFLNVLKNSWNLQKLLESPPETCMWNLRQFREVKIFDREMPTAPDLKNRMEFRHSLNFLQNSWNLQNLLESPPETCMWNLRQFGEVTIFDGKMPTAPDLQNRMKFWLFSMFSKIHEIYRIYWNHHKKHACEIWGSSEKLQFLTENNNRLIIIDFI